MQDARKATLPRSDGGPAYTSITIGSDGLPIISYYGSEHGDLYVFHCTDILCLSGATTAVDTAGNVGQMNSIAIGRNTYPIISYYDATNGDLKVFECTRIDCATGTARTLDSEGDVGLYTSVAVGRLSLGTDGLPIISYYDQTNGDLKVYRCTSYYWPTPCASGTVQRLDTVGDVGQDTSIAISVDTLPVVSYQDVTNGDLKLYRCSDVLCSAGAPTTLDSAGTVGRYTSLTIGVDGYPVMSYFDETNEDLKAYHCADPGCVAGGATTIDSAGRQGVTTSITIGSDWLPIIGYLDDTARHFKVFHCANVACTTGIASTPSFASSFPAGIYSSGTVGIDGLPIFSYIDNTYGQVMTIHLANNFGVDDWAPR